MKAINQEIGEAIEAAKQGHMISREGWNGKGMFVYLQVPAEISVDIIPKMTSLPQPVKDEFARRGLPLSYSNQLSIVDSHNNISSWSPSAADTLAEDWCVH